MVLTSRHWRPTTVSDAVTGFISTLLPIAESATGDDASGTLNTVTVVDAGVRVDVPEPGFGYGDLGTGVDARILELEISDMRAGVDFASGGVRGRALADAGAGFDSVTSEAAEPSRIFLFVAYSNA